MNRKFRIARCKRVKVEGDKLDRLTHLPINVQHQIQDHLSIEEAARMSILSTPWRHVWASNPKLIFSPQFCQSKPSDTLIDIISTILLQRRGAIKTFHLNISSIPSSLYFAIDAWLFFVSRTGLMDFSLESLHNSAPRYKLPTCMYSVELENLNLSNCILSPPCSFRGFHKLKRLSLSQVALQLDAATSFLWMPNLVLLNVTSCRGLGYLKLHAPELLHLDFYITDTNTLKLDHFMGCRKLKSVILASHYYQGKVMNLTSLLNCWPEVRCLYLDGYNLKSFASGAEAERLPTYLDNVRIFSSYNFDFDDEDQILSLLRMFRSAPHLEIIKFLSSSKKKGGMEVGVNHFEGPAYRIEGFNKLQKLIIHDFHGSRTELLFVRFILASAPVLLKSILRVDAESVDQSQCLKISKELMAFPRASPKLEILCEPSIQD